MADWIGHVVFALTISLFLRTPKKSFVLFGALLPDLVSKVVLLTILFDLDKRLLDGFTYPAHTLLGGVLLSGAFGILLARLYRINLKKSVLLVFIGYSSHLFLDLFNGHYLAVRGAVLFPWMVNFEIPFLLPNEYLWFWMFLIPLYVLALVFAKRKEVSSESS